MQFPIVPLFVTALLVLSGCASPPISTTDTLTCPAPGKWMVLPSGSVTDSATAISTLTKAKVVLLGETHDRRDHHQWQLHTLAGLYGRNTDIAVGFEMFPRQSQGALDNWVAGKTTPKNFLEASRWNEVWRFDPALYMPLLDFVRLNRIPSKALNVERTLSRAVTEKGWGHVPPSDREGVSDPAPPTENYKNWLFSIFERHQSHRDQRKGEKAESFGRNSEEFQRFVESQLLWDRAMAEALVALLNENTVSQAIGIIGRGHVANGFGVAHQLRALGVTEIALALPVDNTDGCDSLEPQVADLIFVTSPQEEEDQWRPLLGVLLDQADNGVTITEVLPHSVAAKAGLKKGDLLVNVAGTAVSKMKEVITLVRRQAPGTWLPLHIKRNGKQSELVAKFPPSND